MTGPADGTVTHGRVQGLETVTLENDRIRVGVLLGKGADVFELISKPDGVDLLFRSPQGIVNPASAASVASRQGSFMDAYEGGWQELFPTLGLPTDYYGAELGEHGEVAMLPWDCESEEAGPDGVAAVLIARCRRTPFTLRRTMRIRPGSALLEISETATNEGGQPLEFMWGHHPVFGPPLLEPGARLALDGGTVHPMSGSSEGFQPSGDPTPWPEYVTADGVREDLSVIPEPDARHVSELYIDGLPEGAVSLMNPRLGLGVRLRWDVRLLPYLWLWRTLGPAEGYPWYGRTFSLGLEPFSSVPPAFESARAAGTLLRLEPRESRSLELSLEIIRHPQTDQKEQTHQ
jgi:galactose mutarotase-like enzyme